MRAPKTLKSLGSLEGIQTVFLQPLTTPSDSKPDVSEPVVTWSGLSQVKIVEYSDLEPPIRPIKTITLPSISSLIPTIKEQEKPVSAVQSQKQELALETLDKIDVSKLNESIVQKKGGYSLQNLKIFAKQLGIKANQPKPVLARQILDRIKLKEK
jgi:hypothetical protein